MIISFKTTNTTNSDVSLQIDGITIQSEYLYKGQDITFEIESEHITNYSVITIENSDIIYDISESVRDMINNYVKPVIKTPVKSTEVIKRDQPESNLGWDKSNGVMKMTFDDLD